MGNWGTAANNPILSGSITGPFSWIADSSARPKTYFTSVPSDITITEVYVNKKRAILARTPNHDPQSDLNWNRITKAPASNDTVSNWLEDTNAVNPNSCVVD